MPRGVVCGFLLSCEFLKQVVETEPYEQLSHAVVAWVRDNINRCDVIHAHEWGGLFIDLATLDNYRQLKPGKLRPLFLGRIVHCLACQGSTQEATGWLVEGLAGAAQNWRPQLSNSNLGFCSEGILGEGRRTDVVAIFPCASYFAYACKFPRAFKLPPQNSATALPSLPAAKNPTVKPHLYFSTDSKTDAF